MTDTSGEIGGPVGDWVVVPDGRIGQVWSPHAKDRLWWVAFGTHAEAFKLADLTPAEGTTDYVQEGIQL